MPREYSVTVPADNIFIAMRRIANALEDYIEDRNMPYDITIVSHAVSNRCAMCGLEIDEETDYATSELDSTVKICYLCIAKLRQVF